MRFLRSFCVALLGAILAAKNVDAQVTIDGVIYTHFRYGLERDSSLTPVTHPNNFELERAYINARSKSDGGVSTRVTVDVDGRRASANQQTIRLKYAFVDWTPEGSAITYRLGMQNTPIVGYIEDVWGYRMQGTVAVDRTRYLSSSDIGVAAEGAWRSNAITAHAGVFNGENYNGAPGDHRKDAAARVSVRLLETDNPGRTGGLRLTGFASIGRMTTGGVRDRFSGVLTYQSRTMTLGAEYWLTRDSTLADARTEGRLLSLFATHQRAGSKLGLMARVDSWDSDTERSPALYTATASSQVRVIGGVSYQLAKNVRLLLDADIVSAEGDFVPNTLLAANRSVFVHSEIKF